MAKKPIIYDQAAVSIAGDFVVQQTRVSVTYEDSDEVLLLLAGGGKTTMTVAPGGRVMKVQWDMVVPSTSASDLLHIRDYYLTSERVQIGVTLLGSGRQMVSTGFIQEPKLTADAKSSLSYSLSWVGEPAEFA